MAGLSFFYHGTKQSNMGKFPEDFCIEETETLTYDLIINISCLDEGVYDLVVNGGITMMYFLVFIILCNGWNWIQPVKKWIPDCYSSYHRTHRRIQFPFYSVRRESTKMV